MQYRNDGKNIIIRLDGGDEVVGSLKGICGKENVSGAAVSGIGAARMVEIAHYDTKAKKYNSKRFEGMLEIVSLSGNVSMLGGQIVPHIHVAIGLHDFSTVSGHLMAAEVYPTCEMVLTPLGTKIERKFDERTGLNLQRL